MPTTETITRRQIKILHGEALAAMDWLQAAICTLAIEGSLDEEIDDLNLSPSERAWVQGMTQEQAIAACARAIAHAEAQS